MDHKQENQLIHSMISECDKYYEKNKSCWDKRDGGAVLDRKVGKGLSEEVIFELNDKSWPSE